jgi:hypothetical protein
LSNNERVVTPRTPLQGETKTEAKNQKFANNKLLLRDKNVSIQDNPLRITPICHHRIVRAACILVRLDEDHASILNGAGPKKQDSKFFHMLVGGFKTFEEAYSKVKFCQTPEVLKRAQIYKKQLTSRGIDESHFTLTYEVRVTPEKRKPCTLADFGALL